MQKDLLEFRNKFEIEKNTIYKSAYWTWSLHPIQYTLGAGILSLNRFESELGHISNLEGEDFAKIVRVIEQTLHRAFDYDKINYLMLMMVDRQVHYHVIPRYNHSVIFEEKEYSDIWWPKPPRLDEYTEPRFNTESIKHLLNDLLVI